MKRYSKIDLATIILKLIHQKYDSPEKILTDFQSRIKTIIKSNNNKQLTDAEILHYSKVWVEDLFENMHLITVSAISNELSEEIVNKSSFPGIEIEEYKDYIDNFAKEMMKQLLQAKYNHLKKEIAKIKRINNAKNRVKKRR